MSGGVQEGSDPREEKRRRKAAQRAEKLARLEQKRARAPPSANSQLPSALRNTSPGQRTGGYDPQTTEKKWRERWHSEQAFLPKAGEKVFSMCIPPPNVTGSLHIGHAMMIAIEDSIARYKRLTGHEVLFLPSLDHAGIATQNVVMRHTGHGISRDDFDREARHWADRYGKRICEQFDRLGCSLDYSRKVFTLDESVSKSVRHAFVTLWRRNLIYRANRLVNWCGKLKTSISDLEVNYREIGGDTMLEADGSAYRFGVMYYVRYCLGKTSDDSPVPNCYVVVGTTRPETILGDAALSVSDRDERFRDPETAISFFTVPDVNACSITMNDRKNNTRSIADEDEGAGSGDAYRTKILIDNFDTQLNLSETKNRDDGDKGVCRDDRALNTELKMERKNKYKCAPTSSSHAHNRTQADTGLFAENPLTGQRIPVLRDARVDRDFGTGVLKVTPAHDPLDHAIGETHGLQAVSVLDEKNCIVATLPGISGTTPYAKLGRFEARARVVADLKERKMLVREEPHSQILPVCSRSGDIIEPRLKEQWWLRCDKMAARAADAVRSGEIRLVPEEAKAAWFRWMEAPRDWCLSRQLWWGHRIPAYRVVRCDGSLDWVVAESLEDAEDEVKRACQEKCGSTGKREQAHASDCECSIDGSKVTSETPAEDIVTGSAVGGCAVPDRGCVVTGQDEDVLDTWFSSGLWPFAPLGWPEETADYQRYFPTSLLETGSDILFFWVARMVMLSYELAGKRPFETVLLHGIVRDAHGRKMSKSLGNVIDPLDVVDGIPLDDMIEKLRQSKLDSREAQRAEAAVRRDYPAGIPRCGADALRFALLSYANGAKDINLDVLRVHGYARLCNKLYNACKYVERALGTVNQCDDAYEKGGKVSVYDRTDCDSETGDKLGNYVDTKDYAVRSTSTSANSKGSEIDSSGSCLRQHHKWILSRLARCIRETHKHFSEYNFMAATQAVHSFFLYDFCDTFIEATKGEDGAEVILKEVFLAILCMLHPFMPFITEELHARLSGGKRIERYPKEPEEYQNTFDDIIELARRCRGRNIRVAGCVELNALRSLLRGRADAVDELPHGEECGGMRYEVVDAE